MKQKNDEKKIHCTAFHHSHAQTVTCRKIHHMQRPSIFEGQQNTIQEKEPSRDRYRDPPALKACAKKYMAKDDHAKDKKR
jgi:hypothetical protein